MSHEYEPRKIASCDFRHRGGWFVWDRLLQRVVSFHGKREWEARLFATQGELDV